VSDTIEILKQRISDHIKASDERCIASKEFLRQATDLAAISRERTSDQSTDRALRSAIQDFTWS
jgi:hypothetical protein